MFNDTCCPEYEQRGTMKDDSYWNNCRTKYSREAPKKYTQKYATDDDEYCSCELSDFEELPRKPTAKNCQSARREASKFASRDKSLEKHARTTKNPPKANRKPDKSSRLVERIEFPSLRSGKNHSVRIRANEPDVRSKYRSKSLDVRVDRSMPADLKKTSTRRRSKVERSSRFEDKCGKIERRYSRRDVKKADGVTEVTSLEIVKNWSREAASPSKADRGGQINLRNARWPSRKSTKVIFARYSQDSMDDDVSERSESVAIRDGSEDNSCVCDDGATKSFDVECEIDDLSSESHGRSPLVEARRALRRKDSCTCYDCPIRGKRVENQSFGVSRRRREYEVNRSKVERGSILDRDAAKNGTRMLPAEKLTPDVVRVNNKFSSQKAEITERRAALRRDRVARNPDRSPGRRENFSTRKGRQEIAKTGEAGTSAKRILSKTAEKHSEEMAARREKFCKTFNTPETKNMMNCCCTSSQLDEDHGCSADCRCPESFFTNRRENLETPDCSAACCPDGHRDATGSALKTRTKTFAGTQCCCEDEKKALRTTNAGRKNIDERSRLSRIGYVEERDDECDSDVTLGEGRFHRSDDRQPCGNSFCPSLEDGSTICCCPEEESEFKGRGKLEAVDTSGRDERLDIDDLCPEVPPPDHWTKCGDRLRRVTEEYRILLSRLRDMQCEAEAPEIAGRVRKRISRKYPSGKEFSFEVKTVSETENGNTDDCAIGQVLDEHRHADLCLCEEPVDDLSANWREIHRSPGRSGSSDRHTRSCTRPTSEEDFLPCDCFKSEKKRKRKRWKATADETDLVKTLEAFCAKVKAMDRELATSIVTSDDKIRVDGCECDESEDVDVSELSCDKYCDACVGTDSAGKIKSDESDDVTMAPRIAKPCGVSKRTNLKKIFIYPPDGEDGPPLTLLKKSSDIDCTIVSDANNRFRYKVTYKQNFLSPAWCPVDQCCGRGSDEYRNTDDYG